MGWALGLTPLPISRAESCSDCSGSLVYVVAVLRTLAFYYQAPMVEVTIDDQKIVQPSLMLSIMNGQRFGGRSL